MFESIIRYLKRYANNSTLESYKKLIEKINDIKLSVLQDRELLEESWELIKRAQQGLSLDGLLVDAFALVKEAAWRGLKIKAYDEQLMAGIAIHQGRIAEMQTGEGKTLAAVFPAYLNSLQGRGVHILTFNDYLARRDANWMEPVYKLLGLTVGYIQQEMSREERRKAYECDVTYITAKEVGFDYLRDYMCCSKEDMVQRSFNYAIVDEADSILIDEARIPLVIAASTSEAAAELLTARDAVRRLKPGAHYATDEYIRNIYLTEEGIDEIENYLGCGNLYNPENYKLLNQINSALHAEVLLQKDVDYIIREGKIEMIDEFTGRVAENRHWPDALQAALETKEGLRLQTKGRIMGHMTLQGFMLMYKKIAGMTGTAMDSGEEFMDLYGIDIVEIPPHRQHIRKDFPDAVFTHKKAKLKALVEEILLVHATGQPILIGTGSVRESIELAEELKKSRVDCRILNAKNDELEASIIAEAGAVGAVTVSTNMAGRGTDIRLGGSLEKDREKVAALGGLYVIGTNRYESRRIDKQLRGRSGRQGDPGTTRFFVSLEDALLMKYGLENILPNWLRPEKQDKPLENSRINNKVDQVQRIIQGQNSDIARELWKYSQILEKHRVTINHRRREILEDPSSLNILKEKEPDLFAGLLSALGQERLRDLEKTVTLYHMDEEWADYLLKAALLREGIHLNAIGGKNPIEVYRLKMAEEFENLEKEITQKILDELRNIEISEESLTKIRERMKSPSNTWTYLINDNTLNDNLGMMLLGMGGKGGAALGAIFALPMIIVETFLKRGSRKDKKLS